MKSFDEIHDMIATAHAGDGDRLLNICQALLEQVRHLNRKLELLDNSKADAPPPAIRFSTSADELRRQRERFIRAECVKGHVIRTATAMDLDAFEKSLCPQQDGGLRCGATLSVYRIVTRSAS